jgi:mono/diheme cytochrome c family protein
MFAFSKCYPAGSKSKAVIDASPGMQYLLNNDFSRYPMSPASGGKFEGLANENAIITVLMEPLGIDTSDWSTDFGTGGRFAFSQRFGVPGHDMDRYKYAIANVLPDAAALGTQSCDELMAVAIPKIDKALADGTLQKMRDERAPKRPTGPDITARCARCHVDGGDDKAPAFPFDDPAKLALELAKPYSKRGTLLDEINYRTSDMAARKYQMPPAGRLPRDQYEILMNYLKELK